ncbi:hypothetical protein D3C80_1443520 [compost metagenome]
MVDRQACAYGGVVQPVTPGFFKGIVDLTVFIGAAGTRQFIRADDMETMAGEIQILVGKLFAGRNIQHH